MEVLTKYSKAKLDEKSIRNQGWLSRTFLSPQYGIIAKGRTGKLEQQNLKMPGDQATELTSALFEKNWAEEVANAKAKGQEPSLLRVLRKTFVRRRGLHAQSPPPLIVSLRPPKSYLFSSRFRLLPAAGVGRLLGRCLEEHLVHSGHHRCARAQKGAARRLLPTYYIPLPETQD
jgi:hypothetical protein